MRVRLVKKAFFKARWARPSVQCRVWGAVGPRPAGISAEAEAGVRRGSVCGARPSARRFIYWLV